MITQMILQWEHRRDMVVVVSFLDNNPSPSLADLYWTFRDNDHRPSTFSLLRTSRIPTIEVAKRAFATKIAR
jgi:hypothetical protein